MSFDMVLASILPVLLAAFVAQASPGPATLAIAREAMAYGRGNGIALALVFSCAPMATRYARLRRGFEAVFATVFASAAIGFLASALRPAQLALTRSPG
jgi:threonine/homoserine/homoserine lactone efflux protein